MGLGIQAIAIEIPSQIDFMSKYIGEEQISSTSTEKIYRLCAHLVSLKLFGKKYFLSDLGSDLWVRMKKKTKQITVMKVRFNSFALLISILMHSSFHAEELHMLLYKSLHNMPIPSSTVNADAHSKKS